MLTLHALWSTPLHCWGYCAVLQLEQLQRDQQAAEVSFELSFAALKEQVTGVLNRYFSKDIDLQQAMGEMQALGIDVVSMDELHRCGQARPGHSSGMLTQDAAQY